MGGAFGNINHMATEQQINELMEQLLNSSVGRDASIRGPGPLHLDYEDPRSKFNYRTRPQTMIADNTPYEQTRMFKDISGRNRKAAEHIIDKGGRPKRSMLTGTGKGALKGLGGAGLIGLLLALMLGGDE